MMLVVLLLLLFLSIQYYQKTTLVCASTLLFLPHFSSGLGEVKLQYLVFFFQIFLFYTKGVYKKEGNAYPKWIALLTLFTGFCYCISTWFGVQRSQMGVTVVNVVCYFWYPYVVWKLLRTRRDVLFYLKSLFCFFSIVGGYALVELGLGHNVYSEFVNANGLASGILGGEESSERFGLLRCNSILPYCSTMGMACGVIFMMVLYLRISHICISKRMENFLLCMMPFCVLLAGTRSQFVFTAICVFPFLFYSSFFKSKISKTIFVVVFLAFIFGYEYIFMIVDSIVNSNKANMGSSSDLRENQLNICLYYFERNPLWGYGRNYIWDYVKMENPLLLGAESVWFQIMVDYGVMGIITYLACCLSTSFLLMKHSKILAFFPLAFLVGKTLSIVIGIELNFMFIISFVMLKIQVLLIENKDEKNRISYHL